MLFILTELFLENMNIFYTNRKINISKMNFFLTLKQKLIHK